MGTAGREAPGTEPGVPRCGPGCGWDALLCLRPCCAASAGFAGASARRPGRVYFIHLSKSVRWCQLSTVYWCVDLNLAEAVLAVMWELHTTGRVQSLASIVLWCCKDLGSSPVYPHPQYLHSHFAVGGLNKAKTFFGNYVKL
jgi:hypothetical protein